MARTVVIGLDGEPLELLTDLCRRGAMPALAAVVRESRLLGMSSTLPPLSSVAWSTVLTGRGPGEHGVFGFVEIDGAPVPPRVYEELLRSYDEGVAEFLGLERVKPNTLGNSRMLLRLEDDVPGRAAAPDAPSQKGRRA